MDLDWQEDSPIHTPPPRRARDREPELEHSGKKSAKPCSRRANGGFAERWKSCTVRFQSSCKMGDALADLRQLTPYQKELAKKTWLVMTPAGCRCIACEQAKMQGPWAQGTACAEVADFRLHHVVHHSKGKQHKAAVEAFLGLTDGSVSAPPVDEFKAMLHRLQKGQSERELSEHKNCSDKVRLMIWSLQEALLEEDRRVLAEASSICLMRDARKQRLLIRYGTCSKTTLDCRSGILGQTRNMGDSGGNLLQATRKILEDFCTENAHPPRWYAGPEPQFCGGLFDRLTQHVEVVVSDAAANEIVATAASAGDRDPRIEKEGATSPLFPNLLLIGRDSAHAYRKVLQRPYLADEQLSSLMTDYVLSSDSMLQIVSKSFEFNGWFAEEIQRMEASPWGKNCRNLKSAKHRFESHTIPIGRLLMYLPAFVNVVQRITETRGGKEAGKASQWLSRLTSQRILLLAMLADAGDEGLLLIRAVDREDVDLSELSNHVRAFHDRVVWLFSQGHIVQCGYTKHAMDMLKGESLTFFAQGAGFRLRPVTDGYIQECLARMRCWTKLALEVLRTEFPNYSLFNAMNVLNLSSSSSGGGAHRCSDGQAQDMIARLAKAFKVNPEGLAQQLDRLRPMAEQLRWASDLPNKEAWVQVMLRTQHRKSMRDAYPATDLLPVLSRYLSWQASTSGVEQTFSRHERARLGESPASAESEVCKLRFLKLQPLTQKAEADLCAAAREIYHRSCPGSVRKRALTRVDRGVKRQPGACQAKGGGTQAGWLRGRRAEVAEGVAAAERAGDELTFDEDEALQNPMWSEDHQAELEFQQSKQKKIRLESYNRNTLLEKEVCPDLLQEAAEQRARDRKNDKNLVQRRRLNTQAAERMHQTLSWGELAGKRFYVEETLPEEISVLLTSKNLIPVAEPQNADIFFVKDALQPPLKCQWLAKLLGRQMLDSTVVTQNTGSMVQHVPAVKKSLRLHMTAEFAAKHPVIVDLIKASVSVSESKWTIVGQRTAEAFLGTTDEASAGQDDRWYNKPTFLDSITKLDMKKSGRCISCKD
ncbi:unnamed protein product [Symbiodinium sp. CCMP2592]|nr:unnamed protein product [Symbiodinium sp. CCMP2592]